MNLYVNLDTRQLQESLTSSTVPTLSAIAGNIAPLSITFLRNGVPVDLSSHTLEVGIGLYQFPIISLTSAGGSPDFTNTGSPNYSWTASLDLDVTGIKTAIAGKSSIPLFLQIRTTLPPLNGGSFVITWVAPVTPITIYNPVLVYV